jgi:hypothetical protein
MEKIGSTDGKAGFGKLSEDVEQLGIPTLAAISSAVPAGPDRKRRMGRSCSDQNLEKTFHPEALSKGVRGDGGCQHRLWA